MSIVADESQQLKTIEAFLLERFGQHVPPQVINQEVEAAAADLYAGAKVRTFIPVLVQRRVAERLRTIKPPDEL